MTDIDAKSLANSVLSKLLEHQENVVGTYPLVNVASAEEAAKSIAAFRKTLIEEFKKD